jgi:L-fuconolactonase
VRIDTHQHFWSYGPREYAWMGPGMEALRRDYLPPDLAPLLEASNIDGTIAVQARPTLEESAWLLKLADQYPFILGVVGWVDLCRARADEELAKFSCHPRFRGVRHLVQDEPDDQFLLRDDFRRGISELQKYGLTYDLLLFPRHLPFAFDLATRFPEQPFVVDHLSKPLIKARQLEPWASDIRRLGALPNVYCKISGMVTEADWQRWKPVDFTPFLDVVLECFGTKRLMVGSDWPVCTLAASYAQVMQLAADYLRKLSKDEQAAVWGKNAMRFYGLPERG